MSLTFSSNFLHQPTPNVELKTTCTTAAAAAAAAAAAVGSAAPRKLEAKKAANGERH